MTHRSDLRHVPGRHHRRAVPHFHTAGHATSWLERKTRWWRKRALTPAELRELDQAAARRRCALLGSIAPQPVAAAVSWRDVLAELLERDVAA